MAHEYLDSSSSWLTGAVGAAVTGAADAAVAVAVPLDQTPNETSPSTGTSIFLT